MIKTVLKVIGSLTLAAASCLATPMFSFTGNFSYDTDVELFSFTLNAASPSVTLRTWSYAGGTNAAGNTIARGGFEPIITIWDSTGQAFNPGPGGPCTGNTGNPLTTLGPDPATAACDDVYYPTSLAFGGNWAPGTYTVGLSTWVNPGLSDFSDGFLLAFQGFTVPGNYSCAQVSSPNHAADQPFCDSIAADVQRDGHWALDILNVDRAVDLSVSSTPEPGTLSFALLSVALILFANRSKSSRAIGSKG